MKNQKGISLIEILVVVAMFATIGVLVTRTIILSLQGTQKSASTFHARENLDYAMSVIERQIRNADSIDTSSIPCDGSSHTEIDYKDQNGLPGSFSCPPGDGTIASGSAVLTSSTVQVTNCSFTCSTSSSGNQSVSIDLTIQDASATGIEGAQVSASTQIDLMNY